MAGINKGAAARPDIALSLSQDANVLKSRIDRIHLILNFRNFIENHIPNFVIQQSSTSSQPLLPASQHCRILGAVLDTYISLQ
jgi:hypothetical protein